MFWNNARSRARFEALQPLVTVVLIFRITIIVIYASNWGRVRAHAFALLRVSLLLGHGKVTAAEESARLAFALEQIGECAARAGLNKEHPPKCWTRFAREEAEDSFRSASVEGGHTI